MEDSIRNKPRVSIISIKSRDDLSATYAYVPVRSDQDFLVFENKKKHKIFYMPILLFALFIMCFILTISIFSITTGKVQAGSIADWVMAILTLVLGSAALITYTDSKNKENESQNKLKLNKVVDLLSKSYDTLLKVDSFTGNQDKALNYISLWEQSAHLLTRANKLANSIDSNEVQIETIAEFNHYQLKFNEFFQNKNTPFFFCFDIYQACEDIYSSCTVNLAETNYSPMSVVHLALELYLEEEKSKNDKDFVTRSSEFFKDFNRIQSLGYGVERTRTQIILEHLRNREILKAELQTAKNDPNKEPLIGLYPSKNSFNTIINFCTDYCNKDYALEEMENQFTGFKEKYTAGVEIMYIQMNFFHQMACGGSQSLLMPEHKLPASTRLSPPRITVSQQKSN